MAQLDVYLNPDQDSRGEVPFVLDIQHDLHFQLRTRLVAPLVRTELQTAGINTLCPVFSINGERVFDPGDCIPSSTRARGEGS